MVGACHRGPQTAEQAGLEPDSAPGLGIQRGALRNTLISTDGKLRLRKTPSLSGSTTLGKAGARILNWKF